MARKPRIHFDGAIYHVMARGNGGKALFLDADDYQFFISILIGMKNAGLRFYAYCLMPNHFHLLVQVGGIPLAELMQIALTRYAQHFNFKRETYGHVFQGRYKSLLCQKDRYFIGLVRYIHMNPVRGGLVDSPEQWPWSGHRGLVGLARDPLVEPLPAFRGVKDADSYRYDCDAQEILPEIALTIDTRARSLEEIAAVVARDRGFSLEALRRGGQTRAVAAARHRFVLAGLEAGFRRGPIADFIGTTAAAVDKILRRKSGRMRSLSV